jgi:Cu+-exporting ATPase
MKRLIEFLKKSGQQDEIIGHVFNGGGGGHTHDHQEKQHGKNASTIYRCPMKCEGEKTYSEPGKCPVCGMYLAPADGGSQKS